jgi:hypothetical protein
MPVKFPEILKVNASLVVALLELSTSGLQTKLAIGQLAQEGNNLPAIPASLQVPNDQKLLLKVSAKGSQIYVCQAKSSETANSAQYEWALKAPDAVLLNQQGQYFGKHYAGPTWEAQDGSTVVAKVKSKVNSPETNAIPWLLLETRSQSQAGVFSQVNWIQRVNTVGGKAPVQTCDVTAQNSKVRVDYTADYFFYGTPKVEQTKLTDTL